MFKLSCEGILTGAFHELSVPMLRPARPALHLLGQASHNPLNHKFSHICSAVTVQPRRRMGSLSV